MKIQSVPIEIQSNSNLKALINELNFNEKSYSSDLFEIKTVSSINAIKNRFDHYIKKCLKTIKSPILNI